jgi:5-hydroxyisourate hydrolase
MNSSPITTHVLDTALGRPAAGIQVTLRSIADGNRRTVGQGVTDTNGRIALGLINVSDYVPGHYQIEFATAEYLHQHFDKVFFPSVAIDFIVTAGEDHYHVPLLLSPYGYSTYRGS